VEILCSRVVELGWSNKATRRRRSTHRDLDSITIHPTCTAQPDHSCRAKTSFTTSTFFHLPSSITLLPLACIRISAALYDSNEISNLDQAGITIPRRHSLALDLFRRYRVHSQPTIQQEHLPAKALHLQSLVLPRKFLVNSWCQISDK
jgi:hypothetical protein